MADVCGSMEWSVIPPLTSPPPHRGDDIGCLGLLGLWSLAFTCLVPMGPEFMCSLYSGEGPLSWGAWPGATTGAATGWSATATTRWWSPVSAHVQAGTRGSCTWFVAWCLWRPLWGSFWSPCTSILKLTIWLMLCLGMISVLSSPRCPLLTGPRHPSHSSCCTSYWTPGQTGHVQSGVLSSGLFSRGLSLLHPNHIQSCTQTFLQLLHTVRGRGPIPGDRAAPLLFFSLFGRPGARSSNRESIPICSAEHADSCLTLETVLHAHSQEGAGGHPTRQDTEKFAAPYKASDHCRDSGEDQPPSLSVQSHRSPGVGGDIHYCIFGVLSVGGTTSRQGHILQYDHSSLMGRCGGRQPTEPKHGADPPKEVKVRPVWGRVRHSSGSHRRESVSGDCHNGVYHLPQGSTWPLLYSSIRRSSDETMVHRPNPHHPSNHWDTPAAICRP